MDFFRTKLAKQKNEDVFFCLRTHGKVTSKLLLSPFWDWSLPPVWTLKEEGMFLTLNRKWLSFSTTKLSILTLNTCHLWHWDLVPDCLLIFPAFHHINKTKESFCLPFPILFLSYLFFPNLVMKQKKKKKKTIFHSTLEEKNMNILTWWFFSSCYVSVLYSFWCTA